MIAETDLSQLFGCAPFEIQDLAIHACERNWSWTPPVFSDFDFWLVLSGNGWLRVNGASHLLAAGVGFLLQPGDRVEGGKAPEDSLVVLACHIRPRQRLPGNGRLSAGVLDFHTRHGEFFRRQAEEALRMVPGQENPLAQGFAKLLVAGMVVRAFLSAEDPQSPDVPPALDRLVLEIQSEPGRAWTLPLMAKRCFLSVPHFTRLFRRTFATSPRQFVIGQRVRRATHLLQESQISIQEIAASLGYADHFFFHRQFKSLVGDTPLAVRKAASGIPTAKNKSLIGHMKINGESD